MPFKEIVLIGILSVTMTVQVLGQSVGHQVALDEVYHAYSPGHGQQQQVAHAQPLQQFVTTKNGQLVRAYPASGFKRLRLVPVSSDQGEQHGRYQGQVVHRPVVQARPVVGQRHKPIPVPLQAVEDDREEGQLEDEYPADPNPQYNFSFDVKDDELTNYQNRQEQRDGGVIKGSYSVVDPDGYVRTVTYTADSKNGFQAKVVREPTDVKIKFPVPTPAPEEAKRAKVKVAYTQQLYAVAGAGGGHQQKLYVPQQPQQYYQQSTR